MAEIDVNQILNSLLFDQVSVGNVLAFLVIIAVTFFIARILSTVLRRSLAGKTEAKNIDYLIKILRTVIYVIGIIAACSQLKIDLSGLLVAGGVAGVAIGFASQNTLSNLVAGILLLFERPINVGENIIVNGNEGTVENIGFLSTRIKTYSGLYIRIPNDVLFTSEITNLNANVARRFDYIIYIHHSENAAKAMDVARKVIDQHPYALKDPEPFLFVDEVESQGIRLKIRIWSPSGFWWDARTELLWSIFKAFRNEGIAVPLEQLRVWFGDEDAAKLKNSLEKGSNMTVTEILGKSGREPENATGENTWKRS